MVGCVCSDGTYKVSCEKLVGNFLWPHAVKNQGASCCPAANSGSCPACHPSTQKKNAETSAQSPCVCRGIENNLKLTSPAKLDRERQMAFVPCDIAKAGCSLSLIVSESRSPLQSDLPPPNRVVLYLHLTI
jgi:hypothetical protein